MSIMNGLLHSKTFRKNLSRWIFMYIAVICLLTSVITYSKYISSLGVHDEVRASKFDVEITPLPTDGVECTLESDKSYTECVLKNTIRPTKPVAFYFKIDLSNMEVSSDVYVRASLGNIGATSSVLKINRFQLVDKDKKPIGDNEGELPSVVKVANKNDEASSAKIHKDSDNIIHIKYMLPENENADKSFYIKITASYDLSYFLKDEHDNTAYIVNGADVKDSIRLDYSAIQVSQNHAT